jgi:hypothetical protein
VIFQRKGIIVEVEAVETIRDILPVHEILRVQYDQSWHSMHSGSREVVVVANTEDIWVGKLVVEQGVSKRTIAVVGSPRLSVNCQQRKVKSEKETNRYQIYF